MSHLLQVCKSLAYSENTLTLFILSVRNAKAPQAIARMIFMATEQVPLQPSIKPQLPGEDGSGSVVLERRTLRVGPPPMYQVVMLNDDFTPMEFVILVLQEFFGKDREAATQIMLKIHLDGRGICGVYSRDIAATKVEQVLQAANKAGHPLQAVSEPIE